VSAAPELLSRHAAFGGAVSFHRHAASETACDMRFAVFLPPQAERRRVPVLWYLAGLTCTEETFMIKAGAQRVAAELGLALVAPDTSPRGVPLPGDSDSWDFGVAAGFYLDATEPPWSGHYRMYSYVTRELAALVESHFPVDPQRQGLFGHSMGGHGALTIGLKHPDRYRSLSAFAPISAPMHCPWGQKAFSGYLGADRERWRQYDACELIRALPSTSGRPAILVDQGLADPFIERELMPGRLEQACRDAGYPLTLRRQPGYDHGYYFISTFIEDHLRHHARTLLG
jgi:S-formylglutathione hydrolase